MNLFVKNKDIGGSDSLPNVGELSLKVYPLPSGPRGSTDMNYILSSDLGPAQIWMGDSRTWITHLSKLRSPTHCALSCQRQIKCHKSHLVLSKQQQSQRRTTISALPACLWYKLEKGLRAVNYLISKLKGSPRTPPPPKKKEVKFGTVKPVKPHSISYTIYPKPKQNI